MKKKLKINSLFAYSESENKMFFSEFDSINIISGKNTSGKSTIFAAILYTFGINDVSLQLNEILELDPLFRLDISICSGENIKKLIIARNKTTLIIKIDSDLIKVFNCINADNSSEHIKLKEYLNSLFDFKLKLESKGVYKTAPIETMFLPYYISQSTGWIYLRKSFGSLDFYKNFKYDFIDYYLGIENNVDRGSKLELEKSLGKIRNKIKFFKEYESDDTNMKISKLSDEYFIINCESYVENYMKNKTDRNECEKNLIFVSNKISYLKSRKKVLNQIKRNIKSQHPRENYCPTCSQLIPYSEAGLYSYFQDFNDTEVEIKKINEKIKQLQSELNSINSKISKKDIEIESDYSVLKQMQNQNIDFDTWIDNKTNIKICEKIDNKIEKLEEDELNTIELLSGYSTEEEILDVRQTLTKKFRKFFKNYLKQLGVKEFRNSRFTDLYRTTAFPSQGVELHKIILGYNFAFNKICSLNNNIHRFPFMLDAIFNEDIDNENKDMLIDFISKEKPNDTQFFISLAEAKNSEVIVENYNKKYFDNSAKEITLGNGTSERSFFSDYNSEYEDYLDKTIELLNTI